MNLKTIDADSVSKLLDVPLSGKLCQEICFIALHEFYTQRKNSHPRTLPCEFMELVSAVPACGMDACLPHEDTVRDVFSGVTTSTFQTIRSLYFDRTERAIATICKILDLVAQKNGTRPLHPGAITACCLFLQKRRQEMLAINVQSQVADWYAGSFSLPFQVVSNAGSPFTPVVVHVSELTRNEVLSFRIADPEGIDSAARFALYDAITSQRQPSAEAWDGLAWTLPHRLLLDRTSLVAPLGELCTSLDIVLQMLPSLGTQQLSTIAEWQKRWCEAVAPGQPPLAFERFESRFDNTLFRLQGYGPKRRKLENLREYSALVGYQRDPAQVVPSLRRLLPAFPARIQAGTVAFEGLHFAAALLDLWSGHPVYIRRSVESEATAWIYLGDEILCEAHAVELRRRDGTYRLHQ